jgi:hypothetical protein
MTAQEKFAAKVSELVTRAKSFAPQTKNAVEELLRQAQKQIAGQLAQIDPTKFQFAQLSQLKISIDQALNQFATQAVLDVGAAQHASALVGSAIVDAPLEAAGISTVPLGRIALDRVAIAQGYTADLIKGLTQNAAAQVNGVIQRAFLGGQSMTDILKNLGSAMGEDSPFADRVVRAATTEILRVHSIASQASLEQAAERHKDLKKQWQHINAARVPRVSHIIADGQIREVTEAFEVDGEQLMYPRDPNGSPENTINCHCLQKPYFEPQDLKATIGDKQLLKDLGISVEMDAAA